MHRLRIYRGVLIIVVLLCFVAIYQLGMRCIAENIPDEIKVMVDNEDSFDFGVKLDADFSEETVGVISINNEKISENNLKVRLDENFCVSAEKTGCYSANLKLFGLFNIKKVDINVIDRVSIIPGGIPIGIYIDTDGMLVLGTGEVEGSDRSMYSPSENIIKTNDYILKINNNEVRCKKDVIDEIQKSTSDSVKVTLRRNNEIIDVLVKRIKAADSTYKIGVWIRDNMQGIGTLTYITQNNNFAALGHGINDIDAGVLMEIKSGSVFSTKIVDIVKGKSGKPGELVGIINHNDEYKYGYIEKNSKKGIFGKINNQAAAHITKELKDNRCNEALEIGLKQDVKEGKAVIRCQVSNKIEEYEVKISNIQKNGSDDNRDFVVEVIDDRLIDKTNGIVQGMSGSPIIQNNKIIGALTHVFVKNSARGYGIFIENMLDESR